MTYHFKKNKIIDWLIVCLIDDEGPGFISGLFCVPWILYKDCLRTAEVPQ